MRKQLILLLCCFLAITKNPASGQVPVASQWHWTGNNTADPTFNHEEPSGVGGIDWVYCVLPTKNHEYIGCGYTSDHNGLANPVIFKLNNFGQTIWIKHIKTATGPDLNSYDGTEFGYLIQVVETPNGYTAAGAAYLPGGDRAVLLLEVDEAGNYIHSPSLFLDKSNSFQQAYGRTLAIDHDQSSNHTIYVGGNSVVDKGFPNGVLQQAFIYKIDYNTWSLTQSQDYGAYYNIGAVDYQANNLFFKVRTRQTSSTTHELFACGYKSGSTDDNVGHSFDVEHMEINPTTSAISQLSVISSGMTARDKDMWLLKLTPSLSISFDQTFSKPDLNYPSSIHYTETGPYTARNISGSIPSPLGAESNAAEFLKDDVNKDERAYDFTFTNDGNVAMVGLVNQIAPIGYLAGNGPTSVQGVSVTGYSTIQGGFVDPVRKYYYDEYMDGDGYLLKINSETGGLIYSKNVGHYSSKDFYLQVFQNGQGNFVISGSSSDYNTDYGQPDEYDALLTETEDNNVPGHIWRRGYHAEGVEESMCTFSLAQTADGGFVLGGDDDEDHDNFSVTKFAPYCSPKASFAIDTRTTGGTYTLSANTTWPDGTVHDGDNIASKIIVPKGVTLTIRNCTIHFASSDHMYDYFDLADDSKAIGRMMGIVVETGGHLVLDNAMLKGMDDCQSAVDADRYMWDGIVIQGNPKNARNLASQGNAEYRDATIQDARYGTLVDDGARHLGSTINPVNTISTTFELGNYTSRYDARGSYGGGIVNAENTLWQDCRFGVNYQQYNLTDNTTNTYKDCRFISTSAGMGDPCFYTSPTGGRLPGSELFSGWDVQHINISGGQFYTDPSFTPSLWGTGVVAVDASINPRTSNFQNLKLGVAGIGSGTVSRPLSVQGNVFDNAGQGVNVLNSMNGLIVSGNKFYVPGSDIVPDPSGVILQTSSGYSVSGNTFDKASSYTTYPNFPGSSRGIQVSWGQSWSDNSNIIRNNSFNYMRSAAMPLQRNSNQTGDRGLQWKCNDFLSDNSRCIDRRSGLSTTPVYVGGTMRANQGFYDPLASTNEPAENRFYTSCNNGGTVTSRERLCGDILVTQQVNYYYDPAGPEFDPTTPCVTTGLYNNIICTGLPKTTDEYCGRAYGQTDPGDGDPNDPYGLTVPGNGGGNQNPENPEEAAKRALSANEWARHYGAQGANDKAAALLEREGRNAEAIPFYNAAGMWSDANRVWNKLPQGTEEEQQFAAIMRMAIDLYSAGRNWKDLDEGGRSTIAVIAANNTQPGYMAAAIADLLGIRTFVWPAGIEGDAAAVANRGSDNSTGPNQEKGINALAKAGTSLQVYPNPTSGHLMVETKEDGILYLSDVQGRQLGAYPITAGKAAIQLSGMAAGIYTGKLIGAKSGNISIVRVVYQP